jgi:hypothetical protein
VLFERMMKAHPVTFFDSFTMVDLREKRPFVRSYAFARAPMSAGYRYFVSHKYAPLVLQPRSYLPGECAALTAGVPVARDEALPPMEPRYALCYQALKQLHEQPGAAAPAPAPAPGAPPPAAPAPGAPPPAAPAPGAPPPAAPAPGAPAPAAPSSGTRP